MKTWILALAMVAAVTVNAQHGERRHEDGMHGREKAERFTPEQRTELQVKKMTLDLDLTEKQQKDIKAYFLEKAKEKEKVAAVIKADRDAGKKPTDDERFAMKSKMLDEKIATKAFLKRTLNPEQLIKLEHIKNDRSEKITKKHENFKKRHGR
ncbi:hypothetical protein [Flavobacterium sp.]|uniref:hypothetical protein n=1 Tax=Flavobacterium sp. TaxID=239 RepID=UPI004034B32E